jgi:hypothetical protein
MYMHLLMLSASRTNAPSTIWYSSSYDSLPQRAQRESQPLLSVGFAMLTAPSCLMHVLVSGSTPQVHLKGTLLRQNEKKQLGK